MATVSPRPPPSAPKEVDYYLNPTELFRWVNYRRWDGARARVLSHPEECSTWIVSRHNTDGRILWRHLPLHLICMQKEAACGVAEMDDATAAVSREQIIQLMDVLLASYPEGASSPDDQGMLPLHLLMSKCDGEPNENVINLLLSCFPNAVDVKDNFGRTPADILKEAADGDEHSQGISDRCRAAYRALGRARHVSERIAATIRDESANIVASVQHEASNERGASQKIITRLEEEMNRTQQDMEDKDAVERGLRDEIRRLKNELGIANSRLDGIRKDLEVTRKERDSLLSTNDSIRKQLDGQEEAIEAVRCEAEKARESDIELISNLKSEVSTSKAMTEALESQLRSRFTNEEYLTASVSDLEEQLQELKVRNEHTTKKYQHELESTVEDNKRFKWNNEELTKKNGQLQTKLKELNKQMSSIISSYSTLNSEHDRLLEVAQTYECNLLDTIRTERANLVDSFQKQRAILEKSLSEQQHIVQESLENQDRLVATARQDRQRGKNTIENLRSEFSQLRAAAAERERVLHAQELAASRKMERKLKQQQLTDRGGSPRQTVAARNDSPSIASSNPSSRDQSSYSPPHPRPNLATTTSSSSTSEGHHPSKDGHLVRLLDERAAVHGTEARRSDQQGLSGTLTSDSSTQPQYYSNHLQHQHQQRHGGHHQPQHNQHQSKSPHGRPLYPSPVRRDGRTPSRSEYPSFDQYSYDGYTDGESYSEAEQQHGVGGGARIRPSQDPPPTPPQHGWRNEYGRGLQFANESSSSYGNNE
mmetsp:Transcript_24433/g.55804  ORF Transcript_24433/g.55804 Transcript_24433/m.55804 type:complete len:766 (-) Transcript_24433:45-2342(-)